MFVSTERFIDEVYPTKIDKRLAMVAIVSALICLAIMVPYARTPLAQVPAFIPSSQTALMIMNLITAVLLYSQAMRAGRLSVLIAACGYLFATLVIAAYGLSFPGVFAPSGLIGGGLQTSAWLYTAWHLGFPVAILGYAVLAGRTHDALPAGPRRRRIVLLAAAITIAGATGCIALSTICEPWMPVLIVDGQFGRMVTYGVSPAMLIITGTAIAVLWHRRHVTVLDVWLNAVLWVWLCDITPGTIVGSSRFDLGWYAGRLFGLLAASFVLCSLLVEANKLYARLADSLALAEERNEELVRSRADLARAQRMDAVGQLTAGVAHDFNNLLTAVLGALEMIARRPTDAIRVATLADNANRAAQRGARLVRQLMTFSRQQSLKPEIVDVNALLQEFGDIARHGAGPTAQLVVQPCKDSPSISVDTAEFQAALLNLVGNARDALARGGTVTISVRTTAGIPAPDLPPADYVHVCVSDDGDGMSAETQAKAFEPFYTTKPVGAGTGLGLSQVYGFVRSAGGSASIVSAPGAGTSVTIHLPAAVPHHRAAVAIPTAIPVATRALPSPPVARAADLMVELTRQPGATTILVVEDDLFVMCTTAEILGELGYTVIEATNGTTAINLLRQEPTIDILLSDVVMPGGMNGTELARAARRIRPGLPVVLASGYAARTVGDVPAGVELLAKPYHRDELARALRHARSVIPA